MRTAKWDNLKFILIFTVVLGHCINTFEANSPLMSGLYFFIYIFHMPAFFFVSGLLAQNSIKEKKYDRAISYLILYVFMKILKWLCNIYLYGNVGEFHLLEEKGVPWFALVLFFHYIITMVTSEWDTKYTLVISVILGIMAGYDNHLGDTLASMRLLSFYPFFILGYSFSEDRVKKVANRWLTRLASLLFLVLAAALCVLNAEELTPYVDFLKCKDTYEGMEMFPYGGWLRALYYIVAFVFIVAVAAIAPKFRSIFSTFGTRTVQVFVLHEPIMYILLKKVKLNEIYMTYFPGLYDLMVVLTALALTLVLSLFIFEPFFRWLINPIKSKK